MGIAVDEATSADADAVVALWQACGLTRPWNDPRQDFQRALASPQSAILVAREAEAIIGCAMIGDDGHRGWIYYLGVAPDRRRTGLGRTMMAACEAWLRARGAAKIQLMVRTDNAETLQFYAALGFDRQDVVTLGRFF